MRLGAALAAAAMLMGATAGETRADFDATKLTSSADAPGAIASEMVNSINYCSQLHFIISSLLTVGCNGEYSLDSTPNGASAGADADVFARVAETCIVISATLNRTGDCVEHTARSETGDAVLLTLPRIYVTGICAIEASQPVCSVNPNEYLTEAFTNTDEVEIYHPFSTDLIVVNVGCIIIDAQG